MTFKKSSHYGQLVGIITHTDKHTYTHTLTNTHTHTH